MKYKIMIVEDEPPSMRSIKRSIQEAGADFVVAGEAYSGEEALEKIAVVHPDVIFTDVRMPGMDGIAFAEKVEERYPHICKVIVSGYQDFDYAKRALKTNVEDYLLKPLERETLRDVLTNIRKTLDAIRSDDIGRLEYAVRQKNWNLFVNQAGILLHELADQRHPHARIEAHVRQIVSILAGNISGMSSRDADQIHADVERMLSSYESVRELADGFQQYLREILSHSSDGDLTEESGEHLVDRIVRYIAEHCGEPLEMRALSVRFGISSTYLSTLFKKHMNLSPIEYLTHVRIEMAQRLLVRSPDMLVKDVAELVGYPDHHYFSKVFRTATGGTPSEYRNLPWEKTE